MNRLVAACSLTAILGAAAFGCSPVNVGDPCTPEAEFVDTSGAAVPGDLSIDVNSVQCETRVCLVHYFKGRVSCPYGNDQKAGQAGPSTSACSPTAACPDGQSCVGSTCRFNCAADADCVAKNPNLATCNPANNTCLPKTCRQVGDKRNYFTINGESGGTLCCPLIGDTEEKPIGLAVEAQCSKRPASDAVYCSCRCDVPDDPEIDKSKVQLCDCPSGFACVPLCDQKHGNCGVVPKGKWGSYCVKEGKNGSQYNAEADEDTKCGTDLQPPI